MAASFATLAGAGFPLAIAARVEAIAEADWYTLDINDNCIDLPELLSHEAIVMGDLPGSPEPNEGTSELRSWVSDEGGRLLYFTGWHDAEFVAANADFFGARPNPNSRVRRAAPLEWKKHVVLQKSFPTIRNTYANTIVADDGDSNLEWVAERHEEVHGSQAVILTRQYGKGQVITIFGSISFPAGAAWITHQRFPELIDRVLGLRDQSPPTDSELAPYTQILALARSEPKRAIQLAREIVMGGGASPAVTREICQVLRHLGRANGDSEAVLLSLRILLDRWDLLTADDPRYQRNEKRTILIKHWLDIAEHTTQPLILTVADALKELERHPGDDEASRLGDPALEPVGLPYFEELQRIARHTDDRFSGAAAEKRNPLTVLADVRHAEERLRSLMDERETNPRVPVAAASAATALRVLEGGPRLLNLDAAMHDLKPLTTSLTELRTDGQDILLDASCEALLGSLKALMSGQESYAMAELGNVREPFGRTLLHLVLWIQQVHQSDPLLFIEDFQLVGAAGRRQFSVLLSTTAGFTKEGMPLSAQLGVSFAPSSSKRRPADTINLSDLEVAPSQIHLASHLNKILLVRIEPRRQTVTGAQSPTTHELKEAGNTRGKIESRYDAYLRQNESIQVGISVSSSTKQVRINPLSRRPDEPHPEIVWRNSRWEVETSISTEHIAATFAVKDTAAQALTGLLGDVRSIAEGGRFSLHGTIFVVWEGDPPSSLKSSGVGQWFRKPLQVTSMSERELATYLREDNACLFNITDGYLLAFGARLPAPPNDAKIIRRNPGLSERGSKHKSGVGYSDSDPSSRVFILSEDGGCRYAVRGRMWQLW